MATRTDRRDIRNPAFPLEMRIHWAESIPSEYSVNEHLQIFDLTTGQIELFDVPCLCPLVCDCENPNGIGVAHYSELCPEHTASPRDDEECPARFHRKENMFFKKLPS